MRPSLVISCVCSVSNLGGRDRPSGHVVEHGPASSTKPKWMDWRRSGRRVTRLKIWARWLKYPGTVVRFPGTPRVSHINRQLFLFFNSASALRITRTDRGDGVTVASHCKSVAKAITCRVLGAADTFVLGFLVTGKATATCGIVGFELLDQIGTVLRACANISATRPLKALPYGSIPGIAGPVLTVK